MRPPAARPSNTRLVEVRGYGSPLPEWAPRAPLTGWTPTSVQQAADEFARLHAAPGRELDRLSRYAYRALMNSAPRSVKRAEIVERLSLARDEPPTPAPF